MKNPRWANTKTKKTQGQISIHFHTIFFLNREKPTFHEKDFFLVINSFSKNVAPISKLSPFSGQNYVPNSLKFVTFSKKTLKYMYFLVKCEKTQGLSKNPSKNPRSSEKTQEPKIRSKNPRSWEKTQGVATLV